MFLNFSRKYIGKYLFSSKSKYAFTTHCSPRIRKFSTTTSSASSDACDLIGTQLKSRALIHLRGPDTLPFLQGLVTNDIQHLESQDGVFALFLNQGGRVLFDSIIYNYANDGKEVVIECDASFQFHLISHLKIYRVRKRVEIVDISKELVPWAVFHPLNTIAPEPELSSNNSSESTDPAKEKPQQLILSKERVGIQDPRVKELGWRFIVPSGQVLESSDPKFRVNIKDSEEEYRSYLYHLGIGEGAKDLPPGNCFPLESNGDYLHGISFHKGCYIGQELTARTHHTGVVRKRLLPFSLPETASFSESTDFSTLQLTNHTGKSVGKVRNIINRFGLALVRVEEAFGSTEVRCDKYPVILKKPFWWPIELSKEIPVTSTKKNE